jgi:hypothetical protein
MSKPTDLQLPVLVDGLCDDLRTAVIVAPLVAEHHRRERWDLHPDGRLPTTATVCDVVDCDGLPHPKIEGDWDGPWVGQHAPRIDGDYAGDHPDPTGEIVVGGHPDIPSFDADRLRAWTHDLVALVGSTRKLLNQLPAVTRAVNAKKDPTDGRSEDERLRAKTGAVAAESACLACDLGVSEVGRLKAGLCAADRRAWDEAGQPERQPWLAVRRRQLAAALNHTDVAA